MPFDEKTFFSEITFVSIVYTIIRILRNITRNTSTISAESWIVWSVRNARYLGKCKHMA